MINATNKKPEYELIPEGAYPARIYQMIHIGTVDGFQGKQQNKVRISFEFPTETKVFDSAKGEQPQVLSQEYTLSFNEKAQLRKVIEACEPKALKHVDDDGFMEEYDIEQLIGKSCLVTIEHKAKKTGEGDYAFIKNTTVLPKGMICPEAMNSTKVLNYTEFDHTFFNTLPEFLKEKIKSSEEYKAMSRKFQVTDGKTSPNEDGEQMDINDIPF